MVTVLPLRSYFVVMASSVATVEASQMWDLDRSMMTFARVAGVVELVDEVVARGEEQLALDGVHDGVAASGWATGDDAW